MKADLIERYAANLHGVLSCFDRILITGTLPGACYAAGMTSFLNANGIRIFDYARFAEPLRERIRVRSQEVCVAAGIEIEHVNKSHIRKEDLVARVLQARGDAPGLVHVISAMEACPSYKPWHDKSSGKTYLRPETGKCLHYYFYFIDDELGLCYLRVPTWAPFGLQFYCNGHGAVARALKREGIGFVQADNAFLRIADVDRAQAIADALSPDMLHERLDRYPPETPTFPSQLLADAADILNGEPVSDAQTSRVSIFDEGSISTHPATRKLALVVEALAPA